MLYKRPVKYPVGSNKMKVSVFESQNSFFSQKSAVLSSQYRIFSVFWLGIEPRIIGF